MRRLTGLRLARVGALVAVAATVLAVHATSRRPAGDPTVGDVVRIGVAQGASIPAYVAASRDELARLPAGGEVYALVTFAAYLPPDRLAAVLAGVQPAEVVVRVPIPHDQTQIVWLAADRLPDDVTAGMADLAVRKDAEAADDRRTGNTDGALTASEEASAYHGICSCVYAAVVRAAAPALRGVAARPDIRAVDPAPEVRRLDRAVFLPPLPEQDGIAGPPA